MTDELKAKMAEGRRVAAQARAEAKAKERIPQPVADLPAGHLRDEQHRVNADHLAELKETEHAEIGQERIDEEKFRHLDNEIVGQLNNRNEIEMTGMLPGHRYAWVTMDYGYGMSAKASIRQMRQSMAADGWQKVEGHTEEAKELIGNDQCSGTTGRGWGDCDLWRIKEEHFMAIMRRNQRSLDRQGLVEADYVHLGQTRLGHRNTAQANPTTGPRFRDDMNAVTYESKFTEADLRRGSIKDQSGRVIQPGYER